MKISYGRLTDKGTREHNEDSTGVAERDGAFCFVLADGLGGHSRGEVASGLAVQEVLACFSESVDPVGTLGDAFERAQKKILDCQASQAELKYMKTTMVALVINGDIGRWCHIGDSRLYRFTGSRYKERTRDHSVPQMLFESRQIRESDIRHHPDRSRLLRVIGSPWETGSYDLSDEYRFSLRKREAFLLCSDGFWELVEEKRMAETLKAADTPEQWLNAMRIEVLKNGAGTDMDNYSAIGVFVEKN